MIATCSLYLRRIRFRAKRRARYVRCFGNIGLPLSPQNRHKGCGGDVNTWDFMRRQLSANLMAVFAPSTTPQLVRTIDLGLISSAGLKTECRSILTRPFAPRESRTFHVLLHRVEWTPSKCKYRALTLRSVAKSVETETDECRRPHPRYRHR